MKRFAALALAALTATVVLLAAVPATAGGGDEVRRSGSCSGASTWKLKLKTDDGGIEAEFEVDQNKVGKRWRVALRHNGVRIFKGVRRTVAPSGSFEVRRVVGNAPGKDKVVGRAVNLKTGEVCKGRARI